MIRRFLCMGGIGALASVLVAASPAPVPLGPNTPPSGAVAVVDTGAGGAGINICTGAAGVSGWLSCIYSAVLEPIAAQLTTGVDIGTVEPWTANFVSGTNSATGTSTTSLIGAVTAQHLYVTGFSCNNSGASASTVSFQDGSGGTTLWEIQVPIGGGNNLGSASPLFRTTSGNGLYFVDGTSTTTMYCNAAGFSSAN